MNVVQVILSWILLSGLVWRGVKSGVEVAAEEVTEVPSVLLCFLSTFEDWEVAGVLGIIKSSTWHERQLVHWHSVSICNIHIEEIKLKVPEVQLDIIAGLIVFTVITLDVALNVVDVEERKLFGNVLEVFIGHIEVRDMIAPVELSGCLEPSSLVAVDLQVSQSQ